MIVFKKKKRGILCTKNKLGFPEIAIFVSVQFLYETISDWLRGAILTGFFFFFLRRSDWSMSKMMPGRSNAGKTFYQERTGCRMSKIVSKINQNFAWILEFPEKLFNIDEKVIWSFLILIAKNKLDEKGTLSLISIRVPFLMEAINFKWNNPLDIWDDYKIIMFNFCDRLVRDRSQILVRGADAKNYQENFEPPFRSLKNFSPLFAMKNYGSTP